VWVLDWYNFIVQHNPTPQGFQNGKGNAFETDLRDKKHGRIYRVVYTKAKPETQPDLKDAKVETLVETLKNDNLFWRLQAQRLLVENPEPDASKILEKIIADPKSDEREVHHAIWTLAGLKYSGDTTNALKHPSAAIRRAAIALLSNESITVLNLIKSNLHEDPDPGVRLAVWLKFSEIPTQGVATAGSPLVHPMASLNATTDRNQADAMMMAWVAHAETVIWAAPSVKTLWTKEGLAALERVALNFASKPLKNLGTLLGSLNDTPVSAAIISGFAAGWPAGQAPALTDADEMALAKALTKVPATSRGKLLKLASTWGVKGLDAQLAELTKGLFTVVADAKASDASRLDAAKQVLEFQPSDEAAALKLLDALTPTASPELTLGLLDALGTSKAKNLGGALVEKLPKLSIAARPVALRLVLGRPESAKAFLDAVEKGALRFDMLQLDQKQALAAHPNKELAERAKKLLALGGGLPDANRQKVIDELKPILLKKGDTPNGKKMFTTHCAKCHKHGAEGMQIGPDLTGFAVHPKEEILIHVLDPSRSVEGNYKAYIAKLLDGRVITGVLSAQTKTTVELRDAENKLWNFPLADLDELVESKLSLMPEGFEKQMKPEELTDLLEFLTQKGKYVPIPLDKYATTITTKGMFFDDDGVGERLVFRDWKAKEFEKVPFVLTDPQGDKIKNAILMYGPNGKKAPSMPKSIVLPCNTAAKAIHFLSGIGGWNFPYNDNKTVCLTVRLTYVDGKTEDHELKNGVHFADYIGRADVPESKFAFAMTGGQQVRYLAANPKRTDAVIKTIELIKGPHESAPVVMAVTIETP